MYYVIQDKQRLCISLMLLRLCITDTFLYFLDTTNQRTSQRIKECTKNFPETTTIYSNPNSRNEFQITELTSQASRLRDNESKRVNTADHNELLDIQHSAQSRNMRLVVTHNVYAAILECLEVHPNYTKEKLRDNFIMQLLIRADYFMKNAEALIKVLLNERSYLDFVVEMNSTDTLNKLALHLMSLYLETGIVVTHGANLPSCYGTNLFPNRVIFLARTTLGSFHALGNHYAYVNKLYHI